MKKILLWLAAISAGLSLHAQTMINSVSFPDSYLAGKDKLVLNGGGTREKYWMDMYVGALYLPEKSKDASAIVSANNSMMIRMVIVSGLITSDKMTAAVKEGFEKSTGGKQDSYKDKIAQFQKAFSEEIKKGDVFDVIYTAETTSIYKNSVLKSSIPGFDFKKAVFGIWLGKEPADEDLKEGMLGQ